MKNVDIFENNFLSILLKSILYFGIALYPLYLLPSGSIQLSHSLFFLFSLLVFIKINIQINKYFFIFLSYLIYCFIIELFHSYKELIIFNNIEARYLKDLLFLTYNFIISVALISYLKQIEKFHSIVYGLSTAIIIICFSIIYKILFDVLEYRFDSFFNNPNQLGYFCVCSFSLIYLFYRHSFISYKLMIVSQLLVIIFSILTASKAAIIALLFCVFFSIKKFNYKYSKVIEIIIVLCVIFLFLFFMPLISELHVYSRIINVFSENDSSLEVRGYHAFFEANSFEALFGMGTKGVYDVRGYEIHSTFAMILTQYGIIGFLIFSLLNLVWILDIKHSYGLRGVICICAPALLYGLTHNGIRFSMFWILFAISIILSNNLIKQNKFKS